MKYIYNLTDKSNSADVGRKAYNLYRLVKYSQNIPLTLFISVSALKDFIEFNNLEKKLDQLQKIIQTSTSLTDCEDAAKDFRDLILKGNLPEKLTKELCSILIKSFKNAGTKVAIRSSSIDEDLDNHSFAGQYESNLNVSLTLPDLINNIKSVWASQWSKSIIAYTHKNLLKMPGPGMGIIVQEMVHAKIAGVLFSQNPYSYNNDEMIIEFVEGLGEQLVSGEKTPTHLVFDRNNNQFNNLKENDKQIYGKALSNLVAIAHTLEKKMNLAVDIEWAYDGEELYLLQMRSITSPHDKAILWTNENVGEVIPDVVTPITWSILNPVTNIAFKKFLNGLSVKNYPSEGLFDLFKGKVYLNNTAFHKTLEYFYFSTYMNDIKGSNKNKFSIGVRVLFLPVKLTWALFCFFRFSQTLPKKIKNHFDIHKIQLENLKYKNSLSIDQSYNSIKNIISLHEQTMFLHISGSILAELYYQFFKKVCEKWITKKTNINSDQLLTGLDAAESAKSGEALWELSNFIREKKLSKVFKIDDSLMIEKKLKTSEAGVLVLQEIENFINKFGHSALHEFELLFPRWWEDRSYVYSNINNYLNNDFIDLKSQKEQRLRKHNENYLTARNSVFGPQKWIFKFFYKKASFFSSQRENLKQALIKAHSELKKHLLHMGDLLKEMEKFVNREDILFLKKDEIGKIIHNSLEIENLKVEIDIRKSQRLRYNLENHPQKIVQVGSSWYPIFNDPEIKKSMLKGIGCSSGVVKGTAKVITSESQFKKLKEGDILVSKSTNPAWTPLFVVAAGVVTEIGGALSHGAIIAREYGIPMVTAVNNVTQIINSGDIIKVNGNLGTVELIDKLS